MSRSGGHSRSPLLFFLLSTRFATSLTFVFPPVLGLKRRVLRLQQVLSTRRPPLFNNFLVLLLDPAEEPEAHAVGTQVEVLSIDGDSGGVFQSSTTARERRRARGRCPRRAEEEVLRLRQARQQASSVERSTNSRHGTKRVF